MNIEKLPLEGVVATYSAIYRTDDTRYLDELYKLRGKPLSQQETDSILGRMKNGFPNNACDIVVSHIVRFTLKSMGYFGSVLEEEIPGATVKRCLPEAEKVNYVKRDKTDDGDIVGPSKMIA